LNKNPAKGKFDPRGRECILIGYSDVAKAYRVWYPSERKVEATRDIVFLENSRSNMKYDDFIDDNVLYKQNEDGDNRNWTYVDVNNHSTSSEDANEEIDTQEIELEETSAEERQGPGRPRIIRTGRPGRPRKAPPQVKNRNIDEDESNYADVFGYACVAETPINAATKGPDAIEWQKAIKKEFHSHLKNNTWKVVDRPPDKNVIGCRMILNNKYKPDGSIERRKARLVAKGYSQRPGVDFRETFAPVARMSSIRMISALAVQHRMEMHQLDVTTAYLNGTVDEEIYMEIPEFLKKFLSEIIEDCEDSSLQAVAQEMLRDLKSGDKVCLLNKALYGLKQAGRQWHRRLRQELQKLGLTPINGDSSVYTAKRDEKLVLIATYVDDLIIASNDTDWIQDIKRKLKESFELRDLKRINYCLGLEFTQNHEGIFICQNGYSKNLLQKFGMEDCNPVKTPIDISQKLGEPSELLSEADYPFRELIGSLMYLSTCTRPDISYAVNSLSQFNNNFGNEHWIAAKRILRYIKGTLDYGIMYTRSDSPVVGYVDADWAGCIKDRKSYTGYAFKMANGVTSWESRKQQTVALSSTEAEYMALADGVKEAMHIQRFVSEALELPVTPITIFNDNQGSHKLAKNPVFHSRTKHIDVKHHFVREAIENGTVNLEYMCSQEMPADVLTKGLASPSHEKCIREFGIVRKSRSCARNLEREC